jgi:hypothetical protein
MFARTLPASLLLLAAAILASGPAAADGPKDNLPDNVRPVPPKGIDLPPADEADIKKGLADLQAEIKAIGKHDLLPDVEVYEKAVRYAVDYKEVFDAKGIPAVKNVLKAGLQRAKELKDGKPSWPTATGYVLRGYRSKIDGSPQPYGLLVPAGYDFKGDTRHRLDFWWHGRGENLSEVNFMAPQQSASGIIPAPGAFILYPYGRYCNANKFAGEIDTLECLEHAKKHYRVDDNRLVARGFSMGGAACWQFAVHYPTLWCAAAPGAGFAETREFLNDFQNEKVKPEWWEERLWRMYDATDYAQNLFNLPTVAYSGEIDRQKQAADVMARELKKVDLDLKHVIGPKTAHSYEKGAKAEVNSRIDAITARGRDSVPERLRFTTYTLRYNTCAWITVEGLEKHWEKATVSARVGDQLGGVIDIYKTTGVTALSVSFPPGSFPLRWVPRVVFSDGSAIRFPDGGGIRQDVPRSSDRSFTAHFRKVDGKWQQVKSLDTDGPVKKPGLQGPIDDAFMDRFVMVKPTGRPMNSKTAEWAEKEMTHAVEHWRKQFRGDAPVKGDTEVRDDDIRNSNLILWGDPMSNAVLAKIADKLPIKWTDRGVQVGDQTYPVGTHVPVLIYPNPLNPQKYVVLNSGFTFREYDYLNNARQVPKLPDYAVVDVTTPPNSRFPGKIVRAGFFGEKWELLPDDGK